MRLMRFTGSPDHANNPGERGEYHIYDRSQHKNVERAEPVAETTEYEAQRAITHAENQPAEKARGHEMPGQAQKPKNGNRGEKAQDRGGGDIAFHRKAIQKRRVVGNHQPCGEYQSQTNANINTGADCRVAENMEPTIAGQMRTYQHKVLGSQDACNRLTRIYGDGCVTSTTAGAHGGLSVPARASALTVYPQRWAGATEGSPTAGVGDKNALSRHALVPS